MVYICNVIAFGLFLNLAYTHLATLSRFLSCFFLFSLLCGANTRLAAQLAEYCHFSVQGSIRGQQEKDPIIGATIYIKELRKGVVSNVNGEYLITNLCTGYYTLICQHVAYHTDSIRIHVHEEPIQLNFSLKEADIQLEAVVVTGEKNLPISTQPVDVLKGTALDQARGQTLGNMLKNMTGVSTLQTGPGISKPVIHGLHSNRILILNNGIRQEGQQWGSEHAPEIDPFIATKLTVVKGAAAVRYGADAIGGVIIAEPPPLPIHSGTTGEVNLIGYTNGRAGIASALVQGGFKNAEGWGWRLQGTGRRAGDSHAPDYMLSNTGVKEFNFSGALGVNKTRYGADIYFSRFATDIGILRSAHIGSITDREEAIRRDEPFYIQDFTYKINAPNQHIVHYLLKSSAFFNAPGVGTFRLQYGGQLDERQEYDIRRAGRSDKPALDLQLFTHTLDAVLEHKPLKNFSGSVGLSGMFQDNNNIPGTGVTAFVPNYNAWTAGVFGIEKWTKGRWELEGGVRYDYRSQQAQRFVNKELVKPELVFHNVLGTVGLAYRPDPRWVFKSNLGTAWRPPNIAELYSQGLHHGSATFENGSDSLHTERAIKWINTAGFNGSRFVFEGTVYLNKINNYIYLKPGLTIEQSVRGAFLVFNYTQTDALFFGTDAAVAYKLTKEITFRSKASLIRAQDTRRNNYLIYVPADRFENSVTYNQGKLGKLSGLYFTVGATNVRRQNRAPEGEDYLAAPESYMLLGLQAGFSVPVVKHQLSISLSVDNALNTSYRDYMNRLRYYADEVGRNITLRLKYRFGKQE